MAGISGLQCCGVKEISGLSGHATPEAALFSLKASLVRNCAFYIFTGVVSRASLETTMSGKSYGEKFAAFLQKQQLGTVIEAPCAENPNSGNPLKVWTWVPDRAQVERWFSTYRQEPKPARTPRVAAAVRAPDRVLPLPRPRRRLRPAGY